MAYPIQLSSFAVNAEYPILASVNDVSDKYPILASIKGSSDGYLSPINILPKFMWKYIIAYLTWKDIIKISQVHSHFDGIIDDISTKNEFLSNHKGNIAIVKCDSKRLKYFWKYANGNYFSCDGIYDIICYITKDINVGKHILSKRVPTAEARETKSVYYYKIFIKPGEYPYFDGESYTDLFAESKGIEINGSKSGSTTIINQEKDPHGLSFVIPRYFMLKRIKLQNMIVNLTYENNIIHEEVIITNCTFEGNNSGLQTIPVKKMTISNCIFNFGYLYISGEYINDILSESERVLTTGATDSVYYEYNITHCTFMASGGYCYNNCIVMDNIFNSKISFDSNCVSNRRIIFESKYDHNISILISKSKYIHGTSILIKNNCISDVHTALLRCSGAIFSNNYFNNVDRLYYKSTSIIVDDSNIFESCEDNENH